MRDDASTLAPAELDERLWECAGHGNLAQARILLDAGANPKSKSGGESTTPLIRACIKGHSDMAALLLPLSKINDVDHDGATAAMRCCEEGEPECLRVLIAGGANVDKPDRNGEAPLFRAVRYGAAAWEREAGSLSMGAIDPVVKLWADCVDQLLRASDLRARDTQGHTLAEIARDNGLPILARAAEGRLLALAEKAALGKIGKRRAAAKSALGAGKPSPSL